MINWLWGIIHAPDDFRADPYGELTNQLGHTMLGILLTLFIVGGWREAAGEMPYRVPVFFVAVFGYLLTVEMLAQRWTPGDSAFDGLMVAFGAGGVLFPLKEVRPTGTTTLLELNHHLLVWIMSAWAVCLAVRVARRIR